MRFAENLNIDFLGKRKIFYMISGILMFAGIISFLVRGLEFGIDFKGGTEVALQFEKQIDVSQLRNEITKLNLGKFEIKTFGNSNGVLIRTDLQEIPAKIYPKVVSNIEQIINNLKPGVNGKLVEQQSKYLVFDFGVDSIATDMMREIENRGFRVTPASLEDGNTRLQINLGISDWIEEELFSKYPDNNFQILKEENVGPKMGSELKRDAIIAIFFALMGILVYVGFRFKFVFAFSGVVTLFHDVVITLGMFSLLYGVIPGLNLEISIPIVAAFLALVGYSINDTVIVFDRIREFMKIHKTGDVQEIMNHAINRTMSRTIITSGTTALTMIALLIFGGDVLRGFAFALTFGIIIGTYSSIFVSSTFVLEMVNRSSKRIEF